MRMANQKQIPRETPVEEEADREESEGEGTRRHSIEDTREEMERGSEGKNGGRGHWTVSFRNGY